MLMDRFSMAPQLIKEIAAHARECYPEEACGIIAGEKRRVGSVLCRGRNLSVTPCVAFEVDPETLACQLDLEEAGLKMTAVYHSHPAGPATPSPIDARRASEGYPNSVMIVCSLADFDLPVLRAFGPSDGRLSEMTLVQANEASP
jgi:proteasome lid subunit RPN8/RPN11